MNKLVKIISIIAVVGLIITCCQMMVFANINHATDKATLLQEGEFDITTEEMNYSSSSQFGLFDIFNQQNSAQEYIYEELFNCNSQINVYSYRIKVDDFIDLYSDVINDNPDLFYVSSSVSYSYTNTNYVYEIMPRYTLSNQEIQDAKLIFENGVAKALSKVDSSMTDVQKALVIHDYICDIATYPKIESPSDDKEIYHSAYGLFYDGNVVCAGYTLAYSYLMNRLGIECEYVSSVALTHAWNSIKIGDSWYNVDVTWDDMSLYNNSMNVRGGMFHNCFLKSDEAFSGEIGLYHYGGTTNDNCIMNDTTYDNYFWNDVYSNINVINGNYYYFDYDGSSFKGYLKKRDLAGNESLVSPTPINCINMTLTSTNYDENGVKHTTTMTDPFVRVVFLDNRFYLTTVKQIISIDLNLNRYNILSEDNYCFGLGISDNNELVYQEFTTYNTIQLSKTDYFNKYLSTVNSTSYNNYADINNDGYINAKDYSLIINQ